MKSGRAKILLSAFFIFLFCPLNASQIEEWQAELDTVRSAERKLELLSLLAQKSPTMDQKIHWAQEWLAFAFEQKNADAEAHAYYILLAARGNMGDFQIVRQEGKKMLKKALAYGDPELVLNAYNIYAGFGYYSLQSFDSAAILYRAALDYADTAKGMLSDSINLDLKEQVLENSKLKEEQLRQRNELLERENQILLAEKAQRRASLILLALGVVSLAILSFLMWDRRKILAQGRSLTKRLNKQLETLSNDLRSHNSLLSEKIQGQVGALSEKIADINSQLSLQSDTGPLERLDILKAAIEMEKELAASVQDVMSRKEEALRSFNYMVGHDLKAPLNSASNIISLVKAEVGGQARPKALDYLNLLQGLVNEMRVMIDGISAYAQADKLELRLQRIDANALADSTIRPLRQAMPAEMAGTSIEIVSPLPSLYADPLLLRQVLTNLLSNAVKATRSVAQPKITITGKMAHGQTALSIEDNGVGIPLQSQRHIFQLFKSAHNRDVFPGTGAGAGLAIVKRIVERHGGWIAREP
ncbi:MAG: hypothetical protein KDC75_07330 [Phaeodactylibacter sp.]|nr:hypothetical protein [Phaeodactylibacter sp.]